MQNVGFASEAAGESVVHEGTIVAILWDEPDNAWVRLRMRGGEVWKGNMGKMFPGTFLKARGRWVTHPRFGDAFEVDEVLFAALREAADIKDWMAWRLPEVGPQRAREMEDLFGEQLGVVIEKSPNELTQIATQFKSLPAFDCPRLLFLGPGNQLPKPTRPDARCPTTATAGS